MQNDSTNTDMELRHTFNIRHFSDSCDIGHVFQIMFNDFIASTEYEDIPF